MMRSRGYVAGVVVGLQACFFASDFTGLDDGSGGAAQTSQGGGASTASSTSGQGGASTAMSAGGSGGNPDCKLAMTLCGDASECCGDLECDTNETYEPQTICCGMPLEPCDTANGSDCCGDLWCDFTASSQQQKICCGPQNAPCTDLQDGTDCCGNLVCVNYKCVP